MRSLEDTLYPKRPTPQPLGTDSSVLSSIEEGGDSEGGVKISSLSSIVVCEESGDIEAAAILKRL